MGIRNDRASNMPQGPCQDHLHHRATWRALLGTLRKIVTTTTASAMGGQPNSVPPGRSHRARVALALRRMVACRLATKVPMYDAPNGSSANTVHFDVSPPLVAPQHAQKPISTLAGNILISWCAQPRAEFSPLQAPVASVSLATRASFITGELHRMDCTHCRTQGECPLWVISGTFRSAIAMSALPPKVDPRPIEGDQLALNLNSCFGRCQALLTGKPVARPRISRSTINVARRVPRRAFSRCPLERRSWKQSERLRRCFLSQHRQRANWRRYR